MRASSCLLTLLYITTCPTAKALSVPSSRARPFIVGVAADSGCGKSTFMCRMGNIVGGDTCEVLGDGARESNTLVSDEVTVICLDDYHLNDREGRARSGRSALHLAENNFDLLYDHVCALKNWEAIEKPIYNHVTGKLDPAERIRPTPIIILEGLHPMVDARIRNLLDFSIYLDVDDDIKFNWKLARDVEDRGHTADAVKAAMDARAPDFASFVAPQRQDADMVLRVSSSELTPNGLASYMIQGDRIENPICLLDKHASVNCTLPTKLADKANVFSGPMNYFGRQTTTLGLDGSFADIAGVGWIENNLENLPTRVAGELTDEMLATADAKGSQDGTGITQTLASMYVRDRYQEHLQKREILAVA